MAKNIMEELEKLERKSHLLDEINNFIPEETVALKLNSLEDYFNPLDPSPMEERSLNKDVEQYILDATENLPFARRLCIKVYVSPNSKIKENEAVLKSAYLKHFEKSAKNQMIYNRRDGRKWRINLIIGLVCMAICLVLAHVLTLPAFEEMSFASVLSESLGILGWVAIWEPAEYYLFGRRNNKSLLQKYMRLHRAQLIVEENAQM